MSVPQETLETVTVTAKRPSLPTQSSFQVRKLRASLLLPQGQFPGTNSNTLVLENLRMSARLEATGNWTNSCDLSVYGMRQVDMNAVTVIFGQNGQPQNIATSALLTLEAFNGVDSWLTVFQGTFIEAQPDYRSLPDVNLHAIAMTGAGVQYATAQPTSINGGADVAQLAKQLATQMGFSFENNGVTGTLHSPYLSGTLMNQFQDLAQAAGFDFYFDAANTLIICPKNQPRQNKIPIAINPGSGLIGYPTLQRFGIELDVLFNTAIALGRPIDVSGSPVPGTNGLWYPYAAVHELESIKPQGRWQSKLQCARASGIAAP